MPLILAFKTLIFAVSAPLFDILNANSCIMKLKIENASVWHLVLMKLTHESNVINYYFDQVPYVLNNFRKKILNLKGTFK